MQGDRREVLLGGLAAAVCVALGSARAFGAERGAMMIVNRVYSGTDGASLFERVNMRVGEKALPVTDVFTGAFKEGDVEDWHVTPAKFLVIATTGTYDITLSGGEVITFGPGDVAFFDDRTGRGHHNRCISDGTVLLLKLTDDFDIAAWKA